MAKRVADAALRPGVPENISIINPRKNAHRSMPVRVMEVSNLTIIQI